MLIFTKKVLNKLFRYVFLQRKIGSRWRTEEVWQGTSTCAINDIWFYCTLYFYRLVNSNWWGGRASHGSRAGMGLQLAGSRSGGCCSHPGAGGFAASPLPPRVSDRLHTGRLQHPPSPPPAGCKTYPTSSQLQRFPPPLPFPSHSCGTLHHLTSLTSPAALATSIRR